MKILLQFFYRIATELLKTETLQFFCIIRKQMSLHVKIVLPDLWEA